MTPEMPTNGLLAVHDAASVDEYDPTMGVNAVLSALPPHLAETVRLGQLARLALATPAVQPAARGRPRKVAGEEVDAKRAWICWWLVQRMRESGQEITRSSASAGALIERARDLPRGMELFPASTDLSGLMQSVYRGKKLLEIDRKTWSSETCEKIAGIFLA